MAQFIGFTCDKCHNVVDSKARTKQTIKLEGIVNGEYHIDLCPECIFVPEGVELRPLRKRTPKAGVQEDPTTPV